MTCKEVLATLCGLGTNCLWSPIRLVAVPNTTSLAGWEADLLLLQPSGWAWEIEIKVSVNDFRREFKTKETKHRILREGFVIERGIWSGTDYTRKNKHVQKFFFAVPKDVFDKLKLEEFPDYAGIIVIDPDRLDWAKRIVPEVVRKAKNLPGVEKAPDSFRIELLRLAHNRLWGYAYKNSDILEARSEEEEK